MSIIFRQHIGAYQKGVGVRKGKMGKRSQTYGNGWKLDFWW